jgi:hypothetical protein
MGVISNLLLSAYSYSDDVEEVKETQMSDISTDVIKDVGIEPTAETSTFSLDDGAHYFDQFYHRYNSAVSKSQANKRIKEVKRCAHYGAADVSDTTSASYHGKSYWVNEDGAVEFVRD